MKSPITYVIASSACRGVCGAKTVVGTVNRAADRLEVWPRRTNTAQQYPSDHLSTAVSGCMFRSAERLERLES
jgi:hypothetical protein